MSDRAQLGWIALGTPEAGGSPTHERIEVLERADRRHLASDQVTRIDGVLTGDRGRHAPEGPARLDSTAFCLSHRRVTFAPIQTAVSSEWQPRLRGYPRSSRRSARRAQPERTCRPNLRLAVSLTLSRLAVSAARRTPVPSTGIGGISGRSGSCLRRARCGAGPDCGSFSRSLHLRRPRTILLDVANSATPSVREVTSSMW